jgi:hypothetical protein
MPGGDTFGIVSKANELWERHRTMVPTPPNAIWHARLGVDALLCNHERDLARSALQLSSALEVWGSERQVRLLASRVDLLIPLRGGWRNGSFCRSGGSSIARDVVGDVAVGGAIDG